MIKSLTKLFSGNIAVQLISFSLMPLITRIYSPEELGIYQYVTTVALMSSPFVHLSLNQAMIRELDDERYKEIVKIACTISFFSTIFLAVIFQISIFVDLSGMGLGFQHGIVFFLLSLSTALFLFGRTKYIRSGQYGRFAALGLISSFSANSSKVIIGLWHPASLTLLAGLIIGNTFGAWYSARNLTFKSIKQFKKVSFLNIINTIKELKGFTFHLTLSQFITTFIGWHLVFFAPFLAPSPEVGLLALALMVVKTPSYPFLDSMTKYAYSESTEAKGKKINITALFFKIGSLGLAGTLVSASILATMGNTLFTIVFGPDWATASDFAVLLFIPIIASFTLSPTYKTIANLHEQQSLLLISDLIILPFLGILCLVALVNDWRLAEFVLLSSLLTFLSHLLKFILVLLFTYRPQTN